MVLVRSEIMYGDVISRPPHQRHLQPRSLRERGLTEVAGDEMLHLAFHGSTDVKQIKTAQADAMAVCSGKLNGPLNGGLPRHRHSLEQAFREEPLGASFRQPPQHSRSRRTPRLACLSRLRREQGRRGAPSRFDCRSNPPLAVLLCRSVAGGPLSRFRFQFRDHRRLTAAWRLITAARELAKPRLQP